jgi:hypothetical protein
MKKGITVIIMLAMVCSISFAADVDGQLRLKLENSGSNTTLQHDKTVLSFSGKLQENNVKVAVDLKEASIAVTEAYVQIGSVVVGKHKIPLCIGNYGINTPLAVRTWYGKSAMGIWLMGQTESAQYKLGLLDGEEQVPGKSQLGWLQYDLTGDLSLYGSLFNTEDDKTICSIGCLYKLDQLELSGEYIAWRSIGERVGTVIKGQYQVAQDLNLYTSFSQINKTQNNNATTFSEIIVGTKYTLAQGLDWETEYLAEPDDEGKYYLLTSRLKINF